jgi:hypothetical protein
MGEVESATEATAVVGMLREGRCPQSSPLLKQTPRVKKSRTA